MPLLSRRAGDVNDRTRLKRQPSHIYYTLSKKNPTLLLFRSLRKLCLSAWGFGLVVVTQLDLLPASFSRIEIYIYLFSTLLKSLNGIGEKTPNLYLEILQIVTGKWSSPTGGSRL